MEWEETKTRTWTARPEGTYKRSFLFIWSDNAHKLTIRIGDHDFGPYSLEDALLILERLKEILGDDGAAMASFADRSDGSTEIFTTYNDGKEWPTRIKLHAYVELADQYSCILKLTLDQAMDLHEALEEVISDIQEVSE